MSIFKALTGGAASDDLKMTDKALANDMLQGLKASSAAYLNATLESATPEVRRMFSEYLSQTLMAHEQVGALSLKRAWYQPYVPIQDQIAEAYDGASDILNP